MNVSLETQNAARLHAKGIREDDDNFHYLMAMMRHAARLSAVLRRQAYLAGWPSNLARRLSVKFEAGTFVPHYPRDVAEEIENLEYGTPDHPPSPVIHRFLNRLHEHSEGLDDDLGDVVENVVANVLD